MDEELIVANPCRIRSAGRRKTTRAMQPATVAELNRVSDRLPPGQALPVLLAAWCGLRSGEVRALRVGDVDTVTGWIHVRQGVTRIKGQVIVGPPKTPAAIRDVGIPPHVLPALREWRVGLGERRARSAYFFPGRGELLMSEKALRYAFDQARDVMDRHDLTFHDLRHTAATDGRAEWRHDRRVDGAHGAHDGPDGDALPARQPAARTTPGRAAGRVGPWWLWRSRVGVDHGRARGGLGGHGASTARD